MLSVWTRPDGRVRCLLYQARRPPNHPRLSVLMPVYNGAAHLEHAVRSVLDQHFRDLELIVVDDGSTDATPQILARLARQDHRLKVLRQSHLGLIETLNTGWAACSAPVVARMDADDWSHPARLQRQMAVLEQRPDVDIVTCGAWLVNETGRTIERFPDWDTSQPMEEFLVRNPIVHGSVVIRRRAVQTDRPYERPPEDYWLWVRLAEQGSRFYHIAEPLYHFRVHRSRYSLRQAKSQAAGLVEVQRYLLQKFIDRHPPDSGAAKRRAAAAASLAAWAWLAGDRTTASWAHRLSERWLAEVGYPPPALLREAVLRYGWVRIPTHWYLAKARRYLVACGWDRTAVRTVLANHPWTSNVRRATASRSGPRARVVRPSAEDPVPWLHVHGASVLWRGPLDWSTARQIVDAGPRAFYWLPPSGRLPAWLARFGPNTVQVIESEAQLPEAVDVVLPGRESLSAGAAGDAAIESVAAEPTCGPTTSHVRTR